jgi:hypothetical protein
MAVAASHYHSAAIIFAFASAASAVALPARVDLDPFGHFLLSCNERKVTKGC